MLIFIDLKDADLLKSLHNLTVNRAGSVNVTAGARAAVLGATMGLAQTANTDGLAEVDVAGNSGGADVEPVNAARKVSQGRVFEKAAALLLGRELAARASLDGV